MSPVCLVGSGCRDTYHVSIRGTLGGAMAVVDTGSSLRDEIFRLRSQDPPVSIRKIAAELGISAGRVQRELAARAARPSGGDEDGEPRRGVTMLTGGAGDPVFADQRRAIEERRLRLQAQRLEAEEMEMENRLEVLRRASGGGGTDATFAQLVIEELRDNRRRLDALQQAPAQSGAGGLLHTLNEYSELGKVIGGFAPPRAPSSALDLEYEIARQRMQDESNRILKKAELEAQIAQTKAAGEAARNHAIAKVVEEMGPAFVAAAIKYFERPVAASTGGAPAPAGASSTPAPAAMPVLGAVAVKGYCPRCGAGEMELIPTGTDEDKCPACGLSLVVENGEIVSGERSLPAPEVQRFAS